jgi:hypothetical protein
MPTYTGTIAVTEAHDAGTIAGLAVPGTFSQLYLKSVNPPVQTGTELLLSWTLLPVAAGLGLWSQVYVDDALVWYGTSTSTSIPLPSELVRIDIGTVSAANARTSYGGTLPASPDLQAQLSWIGGTYEGADLAGFNVYGEHTPGGGIDYMDVLGNVPAYTAGIVTDGYGYGGYGQGGYGLSSASYTWTSAVLSSGTWSFGVKPVDTWGNEGTAVTTTVTIVAPPLEPAPFADRSRLHYTYVGSPTYEATLTWNASPSA